MKSVRINPKGVTWCRIPNLSKGTRYPLGDQMYVADWERSNGITGMIEQELEEGDRENRQGQNHT